MSLLNQSLTEALSKDDSLVIVAIGTGTCSNAHRGANRRRPPAFLVKLNKSYLLLDCGEGTRLALGDLGIDHGLVTHVAITHTHPDHCVLPQFIQSKYCADLFTRGQEQVPGVNELTIYMPRPFLQGSASSHIPPFRQVWAWHVPEDPEYWSDFKPEFKALDHGDLYPIGQGIMELTAFPVYHGFGNHPAMGLRVRTTQGTVVYTGDCGFDEELIAKVQDADLLIADCSTPISKEYEGGYGHMGPQQCGRLAREAGVKSLWMTHYTGVNSAEEMEGVARATGFKGSVLAVTDGYHQSFSALLSVYALAAAVSPALGSELRFF